MTSPEKKLSAQLVVKFALSVHSGALSFIIVSVAACQNVECACFTGIGYHFYR